MGDFFTPGPNPEPIVPAGSDSFDVPQPNYRAIGQMLEKGRQDAAGATTTKGGIADFFSHPIDTLLTWLAYLLAWILSKLLCIVAFLLRLITTVDDNAAPGFDAVIRSSLEHVFQLPVGGTTSRKLAAGLDTKGAAASIGKTIITALTAGVVTSSGQTIQPGTAAAEQFLGKLAHIGIEGWVDGAIEETLSLGRWKALLELVPIMSDVLGLGRLSRRVLTPHLKILVEDPSTWFLNSQYRPTLLAEGTAVREHLRGRLSRTDLDSLLGKLGHSPANIDALLNINTKQLSIDEVDFLRSHGVYADQTALQILENDGWDQVSAQYLLNIAEQRRMDKWNLQLLDDSLAAFKAGEIDQTQLHETVINSDLPQEEQNFVENIAVTRRLLNVKHLTLSEVEAMIKAHIMSLDDLRVWMTRENYPPDEQTFLELLLLGKVTTADQVAQAKADKAAATAAAAKAKADKAAATAAAAALKLQQKGVSLATFEKLVQNGQRTFADFTTFLQQQALQAPAIQDLVDNLHATIDKQTAAATAHDALVSTSTEKHVPLSQVETSVVQGSLTMQDLTNFLVSQNYAAADQQIITDYVQAKIDAAQAQAAAKTSATGAAAAKGISLPDLERAARLGLTTVDAYSAALDAAGYDAASRDLMVGILQNQITSDTATLATRKKAMAAAAKQQISLPNLEQAVIQGLRPIADYTAELSLLGYDAADQQTMTELLQVRVDNAKAVAAKQATARADLATKNISLADLERAVKLGVATIDQYNAALASVGYDANDQAILSASLLAQVAQVKQAATKAAAASKALGKKGVSLAQEQALVKTGVLRLDAYGAFLTDQGYSATDAANLQALLSLQIDQAKVAAALHDAAAAKAQDRAISLAKEEQAVIAGVRTMNDYAGLVAQLGYDDVDQATLIDLLSQKVAAARVKTAAGGSPAAPTAQ